MSESRTNQPELAPPVRAVLADLRRRIRRYVWLEGVTSAMAWLGVAFWLSLALDWFFEPSPIFRGLTLLAVVGVFVAVIVQLIVRRAFVPMTDDNMAMILERRFPELDDSLLTAVELLERNDTQEACDLRLLADTCAKAERGTANLQVGKVFNPKPLRQSVIAAVLLVVSIIAFSVTAPSALGTWTRRALLMGEELWPRQTRLSAPAFADGPAKVARGDDFEVVVLADTRPTPDRPRPLVPQSVEIRYRTDAGARSRATLNRLGDARQGTDDFQEYSYTFPSVLSPVTFDLIGGDDRLYDLRIEVVDSPTVVDMSLICEFPKYMFPNPEERFPRTEKVTGLMQLPRGTKVTVVAKANKPLVSAQVDRADSEQSQPMDVIGRDEMAEDYTEFRHTLDSLDEDTTLVFTLLDTDDIKGREPVRLALSTLADTPPELTARLDGIGQAITAQARIPAVGQVNDDYGIARVWFEHIIDQSKPDSLPISSTPAAPNSIKLDNVLEVRDLGVKPGQKMQLCVKAADLYDLEQEPNVGTSERWLLEIVTPEQLRARLESRELVLRQRFEEIIREVEETRDTLIRLDFAIAEAETEAGDEDGEAADGSEPEDASTEPGDAVTKRDPAMRMLRVQHAIQNCRKNAHETMSVAEAFENIRGQFINNRIDTEELNIRLQRGIADPLRKIADDKFTEFQIRLERLSQSLDDETAGLENRNLSRQQADVILRDMRRVLDRMIELEDFNEQIELLRAIIKMQEELDEQVKQRHKQKIRELLED